MGTTTGIALADNAAGLIHDEAKVRWTDADWLTWLNDAQREAGILKPEINVKQVAHLLAPGVTRQSLPADGHLFVSLLRNLGADGATPGDAVRVVSRDALDAALPSWHNDPAADDVANFMFDPRDPKTFFVYPKAPATAWYVDLLYSAIPQALTSLSDTISVDDVYANALLSYMLYRAYMRDAEYAQNAQLASMHYGAFTNALGVKTQGDLERNPNLTTAPAAPAPAGVATKPL